jgi:hypothetical protein
MPRLFLLMFRHLGPPGSHVRAPFNISFLLFYICVKKLDKKIIESN